MDMKRILQAMDGVATKPVAGANDMAKFLRLVTENVQTSDPNFAKYAELMAKYDMLAAEMTPDASGVAKNASPEFAQQVAAIKAQADQLAGANAQAWEQARKAGSTPQQSTAQVAQQLEEGANPHKVSLPVQMAMQHYQQAEKPRVLGRKDSLFKKYVAEAEQAAEERAEEKKELIRQYASVIAERVRLKESQVIKAKKKTSTCRAGQIQTGMQTKDGKLVPKCSVRPALKEEQIDQMLSELQEAMSAAAKLQRALEREKERSEREKRLGQEFLNKAKEQPKKEGVVPGHTAGFKPGPGPGLQSNEA